MAETDAPSTIDRSPLVGLLIATALAFYGAAATGSRHTTLPRRAKAGRMTPTGAALHGRATFPGMVGGIF
jgi:hypothetical protein